jgi:hypothetical protein
MLFEQITSFDAAHVVDVTTSTAGRVAVAGYFTGEGLALDNEELRYVSPVQPSVDLDAFVALLDASGEVLWVVGYGGEGDQYATGLDFSPKGDVIVQGKSGDGGFVLSLDDDGNERWRRGFDAAELTPGQVVIDNNGIVTLGGRFSDRLVFDGSAVYTSGSSPYLLRIHDDGSLITTQSIQLDSWSSVWSHRLVVDDEDNLILAGYGQRQEDLASFALKLEPETGQVIYQHEFSGKYLLLNALTVDREMRVTFGGEVEGKLELAGQQLEGPPGQRRVWLAQLERDGRVRWLRRHEPPLTQLLALAVDGLGNLAMVGHTKNSLYVQKLRSSGDQVWRREFPVSSLAELAIAADNDRNLWLGGAFAGALDHDDATSPTLGNIDGFLLKIGP